MSRVFSAAILDLLGWVVLFGCTSNGARQPGAPPQDAGSEVATESGAADGMVDVATDSIGGDSAAADSQRSDAQEDAAPCPPGTDFNTDALNCGRCGHSCLGGACTAGACQPLVVSSNEANPYIMAADDTGVYWANQGNQS